MLHSITSGGRCCKPNQTHVIWEIGSHALEINPDTGGPDTPLDILGRATACDATKPPESAV